MAILLALAIAGAGLAVLFERHVARTVAADLDVHLRQLLASIDVDADGRLVLARMPADPRFAEPLSGLYWQIEDDRGQVLRSRSLWDAKLILPADDLSPGEIHQHETSGPANARVLLAERRINLAVGDRNVRARLAVATDLGRISAAAAAFAKDLGVALALLGLVLTIATAIQVTLGLRPLDMLRRGVADVRAGRIRHLPTTIAVEVQPLIDEVNALLDGQEREIERSRGRAADLAHGLKTPLAALTADARRLREQGEEAIARDIDNVVTAMSRHVDRELARARVRGSSRRKAGLVTELAPLVRAVLTILRRASSNGRVTFDLLVEEGFSVPMDRTDLAEVLGNLLDNAARHAASRVRVSAATRPAGPAIVIEDDGQGIAPGSRSQVVERGACLDERKDGAGLGLSIVQDVLDAYGWRLDLAASDDLGGLRATIGPAPSHAGARAFDLDQRQPADLAVRIS